MKNNLIPVDVLLVRGTGVLILEEERYRCALGKGGLGEEKHEGDGVTPVGEFPLRRLFHRPDRLGAPESRLPIVTLTSDMGWCDAPGHADYNRLVRRPFPASHEAMWREDGLYDLVVELGYNDDPPMAGLGSAIFMHVARADYAPTEGCVALAMADLLAVVARCGPNTKIRITP